MKHWYIYNKKADFDDIAERFHISPMLARIIRNRDIVSDDEIDSFLNGDISYMHDPFLLDGAEYACEIICDAILNNKKIRIVGDYDIDGVCASYILKKAIKYAGGIVDAAIPDRVEDGYGINSVMVDNAYNDKVALIITCDNGIKAFDPAARAKELDIRLVVTDHHEPSDVIPDADSVIDPHIKGSTYPFNDLCGAAVAYKLMQALYVYILSLNSAEVKTAFLNISLDLSEDKNEIYKKLFVYKSVPGSEEICRLFDELLMFAGFATIGDVVPLKGENRIFAKEGIIRLRNCRNTGMNALIKEKQLDQNMIESYHVGFILGPCINSAGRLNDAQLAMELFEAEDEETASVKAAVLSALNEQRKQLTEQQTVSAKKYFDDLSDRKGGLDKILGVLMPEAHESIAGIVAGRIKETFHRPVFVVTQTEHGLKGSGRSVEAYNMIEEISKVPDYFEKFGGHTMACGFTLKKGVFYDFIDALNKNCTLDEKDLVNKIWIDMQLPVEYITEDLVNELERVKPYGQANAKPLFADKGLKLNRFMVMGSKHNALKMYLESSSGLKIDGIMFGQEEKISEIYSFLLKSREEYGDDLRIACLYYPQINEFRGMKNIQLVINDIDISR